MNFKLKKILLFAFLNAFIITQVLFYIDEGYYDFRWMGNIGNWIVFSVYLILISVILTLTGLAISVLRNFVLNLFLK